MRHGYSLKRFKCIQCGRCCLDYGCSIGATSRDIERWKAMKRVDVLSRVRIEKSPNGSLHGLLWFDPRTRREFVYCPFLKKRKGLRARIQNLLGMKGYKYRCSIHSIRPEVCGDYICRRHLRNRYKYDLFDKLGPSR